MASAVPDALEGGFGLPVDRPPLPQEPSLFLAGQVAGTAGCEGGGHGATVASHER